MEQFKPTKAVQSIESIQSPEAINDKEVSLVEFKGLASYESVTISPEHPYSEQEISSGGEKVAAIITVAGEDMFVLKTNQESEYNRYATPYLLVDKEYMANPDQEDKHLKGIWPNKPLTVGRSYNKERFDHPDTLSRNQYILEATDEGLNISNLDPTNTTYITGNILSDKEPSYEDGYSYLQDYTQMIDSRRERREKGYGPVGAENQYGTYLNHAIIGRESETLRNGVYFTPGSEALVVDNSSYTTAETVNKIIERTESYPDTLEKLMVVEAGTAHFLRYDLDGTNKLSEPYFQKGDLIGLSSYIENGIGVCRHQAILAGLTIEEMISQGRLDGTVGVERSRRFGGVNGEERDGHAWAVFKPSNSLDDRGDYIIDPANRFVGTREEALKRGSWKYDVSQ